MTERLFILKPTVVLAGRVNAATGSVYPLTFISVSGVTSGAIANATAGMTVTIGSAPGKSDLGRQRVSYSTLSGLVIPRTPKGVHDGELTANTDAYVTVYDDRRIWPKIPLFQPDGTILKDGNLPEDRANNPVPIPNATPGFAGTANAVSGVASVMLSASEARAFTAAVPTTFMTSSLTYAWNIKDGTLTSGTLASSAITANFPPGFRWVELMVYQTGIPDWKAYRYIPVYVRDEDDDDSVQHFHITSHTRSFSGQQLSIAIYDPLPIDEYPEGTLVMLWEDELESSATSRPHMEFIGWMGREEFGVVSGEMQVQHDTVIHCVDVAGRLKEMVGFSQSLIRPFHEIKVMADAAAGATTVSVAALPVEIPNGAVLNVFGSENTVILTATKAAGSTSLSVSALSAALFDGDYLAHAKSAATTWEETRFPSVFYYIYYLLQFHSNALEFADLIASSQTLHTFHFIRFSSDEGTLWEQIERAAMRIIPDHHIHCNRLGQLLGVSDLMLQGIYVPATNTVSGRTTTVSETIYESDWISFQFARNYRPRVYQILAWAIENDSFDFTPLRSKAPGESIGHGMQYLETSEHLVDNQDDLDNATGHRYARLNAPFERFSITVPEERFPVNFDLSYMTWVGLEINASNETLREIPFNGGVRGIVHEMTIQREYTETGLIRTITLSFEKETFGAPAEAVQEF